MPKEESYITDQSTNKNIQFYSSVIINNVDETIDVNIKNVQVYLFILSHKSKLFRGLNICKFGRFKGVIFILWKFQHYIFTFEFTRIKNSN